MQTANIVVSILILAGIVGLALLAIAVLDPRPGEDYRAGLEAEFEYNARRRQVDQAARPTAAIAAKMERRRRARSGPTIFGQRSR